MPNTGVRPAFQIDPRLDSFILQIDRLHDKINKHLFADILLMISSVGSTSQTAFEVAKREQEKMMMLGPILHGLNEEMHDVSIDLVFGIMLDNGLIPEPPPEIQGMEVKVQYISILAQAQKAIGVQAINNTVAFIENVAPLYPSIVDNLDADEAVRQIANMEGAPAKIILDKDKMDSVREAKAQQQNQMIAMQAAASASETAKNLSKANVGGEEKNMLDVVGQAAKISQ